VCQIRKKRIRKTEKYSQIPWDPLIVIIFGQTKRENINRMITKNNYLHLLTYSQWAFLNVVRNNKRLIRLTFDLIKSIVKIDTITWSFCHYHYVQNGLSYPGEETRPKLCLKRCQANSGVSFLGTNKYQLLHRIQSVKTFTNLQ